MSVLSIFVIALAAGLAYYFMGSLLYIIGGSLLVIGVIVYLVFVIRAGVESIE